MRVHLIHLTECSTSPRWLPTFGPSQSAWASDLPKLPATELHSPSPFITTQPKSWYSSYHTMEGIRLSRHRWLALYRDGLPARRQSPIQVLTGPAVESLHWFDSTRYHYSTASNCLRLVFIVTNNVSRYTVSNAKRLNQLSALCWHLFHEAACSWAAQDRHKVNESNRAERCSSSSSSQRWEIQFELMTE